MIENIVHREKLYGIIVRQSYQKAGTSFFTPYEFSQQLAYQKHPAGKEIAPHIHEELLREVHTAQEVLFIKKGRLRIDFYDDRQDYIESRLLNAGDAVLFSAGGHGITVIDDVEMFEVKQGPYTGEHEKIGITRVGPDRIRIKE